MKPPELPQALCREIGGDLWYPDDTQTPTTIEVRMAKAVCRRCPEQQPCLDYAIANREQHGIWGGMTTKERRREAWRRKWTAA